MLQAKAWAVLRGLVQRAQTRGGPGRGSCPSPQGQRVAAADRSAWWWSQVPSTLGVSPQDFPLEQGVTRAGRCILPQVLSGRRWPRGTQCSVTSNGMAGAEMAPGPAWVPGQEEAPVLPLRGKPVHHLALQGHGSKGCTPTSCAGRSFTSCICVSRRRMSGRWWPARPPSSPSCVC